MLILRLILVFLSGIAAHQTYRPTQAFGPRWGSLMRYAIGILLFIPAQIVVSSSVPHKSETYWGDVEHDLMTGLLTAGAAGSGVMAGHMLDRHEEA